MNALNGVPWWCPRPDNDKTGLNILGTAVRAGRLDAVEALLKFVELKQLNPNPKSAGGSPPGVDVGVPLLHTAIVAAHKHGKAWETIFEKLLAYTR